MPCLTLGAAEHCSRSWIEYIGRGKAGGENRLCGANGIASGFAALYPTYGLIARDWMPEIQANAEILQELHNLLTRCDPAVSISVTRKTLRTILQRFRMGAIREDEITAWAELMESLDQVNYEAGHEALIAEIVFRIASPEINEPLDWDLSRRLEQLLL